MGTGMWAAIGILSALYHRAETGQGCVIDCSLFETSVAWVSNQAAMVQVDGRNPEKVGSGARGLAPYQAYMCADGYLVVSAPNDRLFERLSAALGHPDWPEDPRFGTNQKRYANLSDLNAMIMPLLARNRDHWVQVLGDAGVPCAPVRQLTEMLADPQTQAWALCNPCRGRNRG